MKLILVLFIWTCSLLAPALSNKFSPGHTALNFYYAYKADWLSLPAGQKSIICPGLVSSRGADKFPYFDEFLNYVTDREKHGAWNFRGLGGTSNPPLNWGYKELAPGFAESFRPAGVKDINIGNLLPGLPKKLEAEGRKGQKANWPDIMQSVTEAVQELRLRPAKVGVDRTQILGQMMKAGEQSSEARWRDSQIWKINDFNTYFKDKGWTAATSKKTLSDGTEIDVLDITKSFDQATNNVGERWRMIVWNKFYGTEVTLMDGKAKKMGKNHQAAIQAQNRSNRIIELVKACKW